MPTHEGRRDAPAHPVWDDAPWAPLPPLAGVVRTDVCVVGLGGSGLSALGWLAERGVRAIGLDAARVGAGAAGRNGGFLLAGMAEFVHHLAARVGAAPAVALYRHTLEEIGRIAGDTPEAVRLVGSRRLAADAHEAADCAAQLDFLRREGLPAAPLDPAEGRGLVLPTDGALQPLRRCRTLARRLLAAGVGLHERSPAVEVHPGRVVTPAGEVRCGAAVVAVDGRLEQVVPELAGRVRTARAQMLATAPVPDPVVACPTYARWGWDYWQQTPDGRVLVGGFRDRGGEDEWTASDAPSAPVQAELERCLRDRLGVRAEVTHRWAGAIAFTPDRLPVLEEVRPRVWVAGAYSGTGNVVGSLCARAAAARVTGSPAPFADALERARAALSG